MHDDDAEQVPADGGASSVEDVLMDPRFRVRVAKAINELRELRGFFEGGDPTVKAAFLILEYRFKRELDDLRTEASDRLKMEGCDDG